MRCFLAWLLGGLLPFAAGCARDAPARAPAAEPLKILVQDRVRGCDPRQALHVRTGAVTRHLHEGLTAYEPDSLLGGAAVLVGGLAESWDEEDGGRRFTFHLRAGRRFHDDPCFPGWAGRVVVATDVVFSLQRWIAPGTPEPDWRLLQAVRGAEEFRRGAAAAVAGLAAPDPRTVVVELARADPFLLHTLAGPAGWVVAPEAVALYGDDLSLHPVGIGPYRLAAWDPALGLTLVASAGYGGRDGGPPRNAGLEFVYGLPGDALLGPDRYDLVYSGAGVFELLRQRIQERGFVSLSCAKLNTIFYAFDFSQPGPWAADQRLRLALSCFLPRPRRGDSIPAEQLLPPSLRGAAGLAAAGAPADGDGGARAGPDIGAPQRSNPEAGAALLAELRAQGVAVPPVLRLLVDRNEIPDARALAEGLAPAGVAVEYYTAEQIPPAGWVADLRRDGWIADVPDPRDFYRLFWSGSAYNRSGFRDAAYDRLYEESLAANQEPEALRRACLGMERILRVAVPALWIRHEVAEVIARPDLDGLEYALNPLMRPSLEYVRAAPGAPGRPAGTADG